ncbi:hypothetical protein [Paraburkholderia aromaticivorans]|uniref:hypothetical protein n=1 Tax=Paraburkholderia aromaticivorans TaxID=2026199 RepID=UPI0038BADAA7
MSKRVLTVEQILLEITRRIQKEQQPDGPAAAVVLPVPKAHAPDAEGRNWDIAETKQEIAYNAYVRRVVEEARREFYLTAAADHDRLIGDAFTHT